MKPILPAELHSLASYPALPAIPAVAFSGKEPISGRMNYNLIPPSGGHTLLDFYFVGALRSLEVLYGYEPLHEEATEEDLDRVASLAWRLAIAAVRTRPDTGPIPSGVPKDGLK
jgi:hypothetical protein